MRRPARLSLLSAALFTPSLFAADLYVTPGGSIQSAIDAATTGDRVLVSAGTYFERIDFHGQAISVIGIKGATATTLNGGGVGPVVRFDTAEGTTSRLQGFSVTGGSATLGAGGIAAAAGTRPTIEDCVIFQNSGKFGGGVSGSPVMRRCVIRNNTASLTHGGGLYGAPEMKYCVIANNTATSADGGGAYINAGTTLEDCLFIDNRAIFADSQGGGLSIHTASPVTLTRCVIAGNSASGGVFAGVGGGLFATSGTTLIDCAVIGNTLTGSSINGGGLYGAATLVNTIVRGNTLPQLTSVGSVTYCDVEGGFAGTGNFDADPLFVDAVGSDYHLLRGSPCVDSGDPSIFDPDGTRSDVGAFPFETLYVANPDWANPSWPELSVTVGGRQVIRLLPDAMNSNHLFLTAGTLSGTTPGISFLGQPVPLNQDAYFLFTLTNPNTPLLANSFGQLDAMGTTTTTFQLASDPLSPYAGTTLHHAMMVGTATPSLTLVTNAVPLLLVP